MPITTKHGSIFDSHADVLVCPVNCVGVMDKGLTKEFKRRWIDAAYGSYSALDFYEHLCEKGSLKPGRAYYLYDYKVMLSTTKEHWKNQSRIHWINDSLINIGGLIRHYSLPSVAIPQLGCGCGGLDWADVWPLYEKHLGGLACDVEVWIYE